MNVNEINKKLRCYVSEQDNMNKEDSIDLIKYFEIYHKIEIKDGTNYLYSRFGRGMSNYSFGTVYGEKKVFFDTTKNKIIYDYNNWHDYIRIYHEYGYDQINDRLIDENGEPISKDFILYDIGKRARDEFLNYYKSCKNSKPYFKPLYIDGNFYIDSELNLYTYDSFHATNNQSFFSLYEPKTIANLNDLLKYLLDDKTNNNKCAIELKNILNEIRISIDTLPPVYREFIEKEKCSDNKIYSHKLNR